MENNLPTNQPEKNYLNSISILYPRVATNNLKKIKIPIYRIQKKKRNNKITKQIYEILLHRNRNHSEFYMNTKKKENIFFKDFVFPFFFLKLKPKQ